MIKRRLSLIVFFALIAGASLFTQITRAQTGRKKSAAAKKAALPPAPKTPHAALAVDKSDGFYYGFSYDHPSLQTAEQRALDECTKRGGKCSVVLSWTGTGCGAYRTVSSKVGYAYGWGIAPTKEAADAIATAEATKRSNRQPVPNFAFACNSAGPAAFEILRNDDRHTHEVNTLTFSPDGRKLLSGSYDSSAKLWDLARGSMLLSVTAPQNVTKVFFLDGGRQFGFVARHEIAIHDTSTAQPSTVACTVAVPASKSTFTASRATSPTFRLSASG